MRYRRIAGFFCRDLLPVERRLAGMDAVIPEMMPFYILAMSGTQPVF
jgi:hypothetical protein